MATNKYLIYHEYIVMARHSYPFNTPLLLPFIIACCLLLGGALVTVTTPRGLAAIRQYQTSHQSAFICI